MNYLEWTEVVLRAVIAGKTSEAKFYGSAQLPSDLDVAGDRDATEAIDCAMTDLEEIGMLELRSSGWDARFTQNTRMIRDGVPLSSAWPQIVKTYLDDQQLAFLRGLVDIAMAESERYALPRHVHVRDVFSHLGWPTEDIQPFYDLTTSLRAAGCVHHYAMATGGSIHLRPTYFGVVKATQKVETAQQEHLAGLVTEWETSTVDFKRELPLNTTKQKAELVRDVLALANTKASGDRYLVIGFDPVSHELTHSVDPAITLERLEQILHAYSDPTPEIRYRTVSLGEATAGVIQVFRDPTGLAYVPSRDAAHIRAGQIFVRHGTSVEEPTDRERQNLVREGEDARSAESQISSA